MTQETPLLSFLERYIKEPLVVIVKEDMRVNVKLSEHRLPKWKCQICGGCCRLPAEVEEIPIHVFADEFKTICEKLRKEMEHPERLFDFYLDLNPKIPGFMVKCRPLLVAQKCIFLVGNKCSIHPFKPLFCRLYPIHPPYGILYHHFCPGWEDEEGEEFTVEVVSKALREWANKLVPHMERFVELMKEHGPLKAIRLMYLE